MSDTAIKRMKLVFVAGPYRSSSEWEVLQNIRTAEAAALELWRMGLAVICPHKNTAHFGGAAPDEMWLAGDKEMLRRCDAVFALQTWSRSEGARGEVALARELGIPVLFTFDEVRQWQSQV